MASVWKQPRSQYWIACFRDSTGRQRRASTKETDRKKAQKIADQYEEATRTKPTIRQVQKVLARLHEEIAKESIPQKSVRAYVQEWLATKKPEVNARTHNEYSGSLSQFLEYLGARADSPMSSLTKTDLLTYRNQLATQISATTVNNRVTLLRMLFRSARRDEVCPDNIAEFVGPVRAGAESDSKRPFTLSELQAVLAVADPEWRSLVLFGLYTGQRLGDLARMQWTNIDLERDEIRVVTAKTGRRMIIPLAPALRSHIETLPMSDGPYAPLHPRASSRLSGLGKASALSTEFGAVLVQAGLRPQSVRRRQGAGQSHTRKINALSFHSLRRTATTLLHEAGVPPTVAQALIGHDSAEIHFDYIGIGREALRSAVNRLPVL